MNDSHYSIKNNVISKFITYSSYVNDELNIKCNLKLKHVHKQLISYHTK